MVRRPRLPAWFCREKHMSEVVRARYTGAEELANALTHAFGLILSIAGLAALVAVATLHGGVREIASCAIYGTTLILLYTVSTLYHSIPLAEPKRILRILDHLAIFLLIAGTYTPFVLIALRGTWGWTLFVIIWSLAALGVAFELSQLRRFRRAMIALYIAMGWVGLIAIKPLVAAVPAAGLWLLFGGGVSYTFGVIFYRWRSLRYHHAVWHLFVLGGSVLQYFAVLYYVLPSK
jgi:hemolysin III